MPLCVSCKKEDGKLQCGRCKTMHYCCQGCQIVHWPVHRSACSINHFRDDPCPPKGVYIYSFRIFSKDEDSPNYRAGILGTFFEQDEQLYGLTTFQIFNKTWTGRGDETEENVIGKKATTLRWKDLAARSDVFTDLNLVEVGRVIGEVVKMASKELVILKIEDWVKEDMLFQQEGKWCGVEGDLFNL